MNSKIRFAIKEKKEEIEKLKEFEDICNALDHYISIKWDGDKLLSYSIGIDKVYISIQIDSKTDFEPLIQLLTELGEECSAPRLYEPDKCLLIYSGKTIISGYPTGKDCKIVEIGKKKVPVYEVQCNESKLFEDSL